ncbi:O-methyltransferase [Haloferacaceae archaeon DSL9]
MVLSDDRSRFARAIGPDHTPIQDEMAAYADEHGFPIIGPTAGSVLRLLARATNASRAFEFGSGYGYSATWFLRGMDPTGEIVLTEFDADELEMARDFFERAGFTDRAVFEEGDALAIVDSYDGPFDLVLIDHEKERYADAFEPLRTKLRPGGVIVADNLARGPIDFDALLAFVETGAELPQNDAATAGIARSLEAIRAAEGFETTLLPVGSGLAVTVRTD